MTKDQKYQALVAEAKNDPNIIGFILGGGRAKGQFTEHSDYDPELIAIDGPTATAKYKKYTEKDVIDSIHAFTVEEFRRHAEIGSEFSWDRYNYAHNTIVFDKVGGLQKMVDEKGSIPAGKEREIVEENIGGYMNYVYRMLKNFRDGNLFASKLSSAESIPWLLTALFAVENRVRPYNKFLKWELEKYPLADFPLTPDKFLKQIEIIISSGDIAAQKALFKVCIEFFRTKGFTKTIDSWEGYQFE
jgi:predicted nucleotidyltransferase